MPTYATPAQLAERIQGVEEAEAADLLRYASLLVSRATKRARYATTSTGAPARPSVAQAFRDATIEQVLAWVKNKIDPSKGAAGLSATRTSRSLGGASSGYSVSSAAEDSRAALAGGQSLSVWARLTLDDAGLLNGTIGGAGPRGAYHEPRILEQEQVVVTPDPDFPGLYTLEG